MKNKDLLYELMEEINDTEVAMIEKGIDESVDEALLKRQEDMAMDKIRSQMSKEELSRVKRSSGVRFRRKFVVLVAAAVMMFSMVAFARANDWDIEFLSAIGLNGAMEELEGGYVEIGESDTSDGITITATKSIGDKNNQWIQLDTDVPWTIGEDGYYSFEDVEFEFNKSIGKVGGHSEIWFSYNNDGKVSFLIEVNAKDINRLQVNITIKKLYQCEDVNEEDEQTLISDETWELCWKNYYSPNTVTKYPMATIDDLVINKIELSPISIRVEAVGKYSQEDSERLNVEQITLDDGTVIQCKNNSAGNNGIFLRSDNFYGDFECIDVERIEAVTINGELVKIK